jgi:hypothetical protein
MRFVQLAVSEAQGIHRRRGLNQSGRSLGGQATGMGSERGASKQITRHALQGKARQD